MNPRELTYRRAMSATPDASSSVRAAASGQRPQRAPQLQLLRGVQAPPGLRDHGREHDERRHLGDERLRGRDGDLRAGLQEHHRVRLAGDRRADGVGHGHDRAALLARPARRGDRVRGLAGLGDGDHERVRIERRRASSGTPSPPSPAPGARSTPGSRRRPRAPRTRPCRRRPAPRASTRRKASARPSHLGGVDASRAASPARRATGAAPGLLVDLLEHEVCRSRPSRRPPASSR